MSDNELRIPWPEWQLVEEIGRGQFGTVFRISCTKFGITEYAAMKVISIPSDPQSIQMDYSCGYDKDSVAAKYKSFLDEVIKEYQLMMRVKGCNGIVRCDDISVSQHDDGIGWDVFIRMECLTPIMSVINSICNEESIVKLGIDICEALEACEKADILHRDIKPSNILLSEQGDFKLGDFGVSRTLENGNTYGTKGVGTYDYMAPEVFNGGKYGKKADIYSLGMVIFWLLNNRSFPFLTIGKAPTAQEIIDARQRRFNGEALPRPISANDDLSMVVSKACAYNPENRYSSAREMLKDLINIRYRKPILSPEPMIQPLVEERPKYSTNNLWNDSTKTVGKSHSQPSTAVITSSFNQSKNTASIQAATQGVYNSNQWNDSPGTVGKNYTGPVNINNEHTVLSTNSSVSEQTPNNESSKKAKKPNGVLVLIFASIVLFASVFSIIQNPIIGVLMSVLAIIGFVLSLVYFLNIKKNEYSYSLVNGLRIPVILMLVLSSLFFLTIPTFFTVIIIAFTITLSVLMLVRLTINNRLAQQANMLKKSSKR